MSTELVIRIRGNSTDDLLNALTGVADNVKSGVIVSSNKYPGFDFTYKLSELTCEKEDGKYVLYTNEGKVLTTTSKKNTALTLFNEGKASSVAYEDKDGQMTHIC